MMHKQYHLLSIFLVVLLVACQPEQNELRISENEPHLWYNIANRDTVGLAASSWKILEEVRELAHTLV